MTEPAIRIEPMEMSFGGDVEKYVLLVALNRPASECKECRGTGTGGLAQGPDGEAYEVSCGTCRGWFVVRPVGSCYIQLTEQDSHAGLARLWVEEDWRRDGVGSALLASAERKAELAGRDQLILSVDDGEDHDLIRWYEKRGYEIYERGELGAAHMAKTLAVGAAGGGP